MRFLVDEDLPPALANLLRERGHKAEHVTAVGLRGCLDLEVFKAAQERAAVLLTADVAFGNPHKYSSHHGVIVLRFPDFFRRDDILALVARFLDQADVDALSGAAVIVSPGLYRVRR